MKLRHIEIGAVHIPEVRITAVYDEELTEQLRGSLEAAGQLQPIQVIETEDGFELVDGLHRLEEAKRRGDTRIDAVVVPGDSTTALVHNLVSNRLRGKVKASEMVEVIAHLYQTKGWDSDKIRDSTGLTRDYVERLMKISEADEEVHIALDKELIGVGVAFEISRLPERIQQQAAMGQVATFHMTTKQIKKYVDDVLREMASLQEQPAPAPAPVRLPPPPRACEGCKVEEGDAPLVEVILCPRCFGRAYTTHLEEVQPEVAAVSEAEGA